MSLSGKVAIVTGASKGIGRATAERLAADGASVVINYLSDSKAADEVVSKIGADRALAVQADASKVPDIEKLVAAAVEKFGRIDIVVPNAGVMGMHDLAHTTEADFDRHFNLNVKGPLFLVQKAVPHMPPGGRVIFVSTGLNTSTNVTPAYLLYVATKGAVDQMVRALSKDLASKGINVNAVAPGPTGTELFYRGKSEQLLGMLKKQSPFNRFGEPEEIAGVVAFLAGEDSKWVSGQVLRANGANMV
ncbi:NAD(P)-binding protein [Parathielavia appendiculata]|uniref:NAD(P)-binding protein n=1 Tax=Parathielavia appendiculata TaxID=2587402 RepID=A0AAN6UAF8_9PEZI|nr:NAD(P)-binding protein [Parathielavia appendiculata]